MRNLKSRSLSHENKCVPVIYSKNKGQKCPNIKQVLLIIYKKYKAIYVIFGTMCQFKDTGKEQKLYERKSL
jgi:hypothetical protein